MSDLFPTPAIDEPKWLTEARRRNAPYAAIADNDFSPAVLDRRALLEALDAATARATKAESRAAELRGQVTSLLEGLADGCESSVCGLVKDAPEFWKGVNHERAQTLRWAELKCSELGIEWPIKPMPYVGNLPSAAPTPLPSSPDAAGPGEVVLSGQRYKHYKGGEYVVLCVAKVEADSSQQVVVYQDAVSYEKYTRPVGEFCLPRFVLLPGPRTSTLLVGDIQQGEPSFKDLGDDDLLLEDDWEAGRLAFENKAAPTTTGEAVSPYHIPSAAEARKMAHHIGYGPATTTGEGKEGQGEH